MARFSIVIPCFDQGRFLRQAIDSALGQQGVASQVLVVDDGSTDDTAAIARSYGDRIELVQQPNRGLPAARNQGLRRAEGDWLVFLDADDWLGPDVLHRHHDAAASEPEVAVRCAGWVMVDEHGHPQRREGPPRFPSDTFHWLLGGNRMPCHAVAVRRQALLAVGGFDEGLRACEDWDLWLRLAGVGFRFAATPAATVYYRRYQGSMSKDVDRMLEAARAVFAKHPPRPGRRGRYWWARLRAAKAIRYGILADNLLPRAAARCRRGERRAAIGDLLRQLRRHPLLLESLLLHGLAALRPRHRGQAEAP